MSYIIGKPCEATCDTACVAVCPVDCIHGPINVEGRGEEVAGMEIGPKDMLYINPDECIDCGVCEPECPIEAIEPDTNPNTEEMLLINKEFSGKWPNITQKKDPLDNWEKYKDEKNKLTKHFQNK